MNNNLNTARAQYIKHDSLEVKDVVNFADRFWYVLELKKRKLKAIMEKSNNHLDADMTMVKVRALDRHLKNCGWYNSLTSTSTPRPRTPLLCLVS